MRPDKRSAAKEGEDENREREEKKSVTHSLELLVLLLQLRLHLSQPLLKVTMTLLRLNDRRGSRVTAGAVLRH